MSRFLTCNDDGTYLEEIESMEVCRWRINDVCCNDKCDCLGDFPYPREMCNMFCEDYISCDFYEKEDGNIGGEADVKRV